MRVMRVCQCTPTPAYRQALPHLFRGRGYLGRVKPTCDFKPLAFKARVVLLPSDRPGKDNFFFHASNRFPRNALLLPAVVFPPSFFVLTNYEHMLIIKALHRQGDYVHGEATSLQTGQFVP